MPIEAFPYDETKTSEAFQTLIIDFLEGKPLKEISTRLEGLCTASNGNRISAKELCELIIINESTNGFKTETINILEHLNTTTDHVKYPGCNSLYHLLKHLKNKGHERLEVLIDMIDTCKVPATWQSYIRKPAFATITILSFCYIQPEFFWKTVDWLTDMSNIAQHSMSHFIQLKNLPLLGIGIQIIWILYYFKNTFEYGFDQSDKRIRDWTFRTLTSVLNILAHVITYWSAGLLPVLPAIIFVTSSFVDVFESFYTYWTYPKIEPRLREDSAHQAANRDSKLRIRERDKQMLLIKGIIAGVATALIVLWYSLPPNIILTATYMLSLWLLGIIKDSLLKRTYNKGAHSIQLSNLSIYKKFSKDHIIEENKKTFSLHVNELLIYVSNTLAKQYFLRKSEEMLQRKPFYLENAEKEFRRLVIECTEYSQATKGSTPHSSSTDMRSPQNQLAINTRSTSRQPPPQNSDIYDQIVSITPHTPTHSDLGRFSAYNGFNRP